MSLRITTTKLTRSFIYAFLVCLLVPTPECRAHDQSRGAPSGSQRSARSIPSSPSIQSHLTKGAPSTKPGLATASDLSRLHTDCITHAHYKTIEECNSAIRHDPQDMHAWLDRGVLYANKGDDALAVADIEHATSLLQSPCRSLSSNQQARVKTSFATSDLLNYLSKAR